MNTTDALWYAALLLVVIGAVTFTAWEIWQSRGTPPPPPPPRPRPPHDPPSQEWRP